MSRTNNVTFENVFAQNASTAIPSQPITGVSYRDDTQTAEQIETGQAYDSIYNSARYNQLFYQMTSLLADMAKNGLLPFQSGQHYLAGARVLDGGLIYIANREILASEQPYPSPNIDSQAWTPAISTSSDLGGDGASDQAVPSQKAVKTYVDDNFLPLDGVVENSIKWNGYSIGSLPQTTFGTAGVGEGGEIHLAKGSSGEGINLDNYYGNFRIFGYGNDSTNAVYTLNMDTGAFNVAASKLGTTTVGSATKPIYLNNGTATACSSSLTDYLPLAGGTLTGVLVANGGFRHANPNVTKGTNPSSTQYFNLAFTDKSAGDVASRLGLLETSLNSAGLVTTSIVAYKNQTNATTNASIGISIDASGNAYTFAPTPAQTDSSTKIATTAHVKACVPKSIGGAEKPVYTNANGVITACSSTVGSATVPVYMNAGTITACSEMNPAYVNATEIGRYLDFHYDNGTKKFDYDCRIYANTQGTAAGGGNLYFLAAQYYMSNKIVERIDSSSFDNNAGWIRFVSGLQICWGLVTIPASTGSGSATYAKAFSRVPGVFMTPNGDPRRIGCATSPTSCTANVYPNSEGGSHVRYIAFGKWN